jgi:alanine racemase
MQAQIDRFAEALEQLRQAGVRPALVHAGNSVNAGEGAGLTQLAALAHAAGAKLLARPGLALYGIGAVEFADQQPTALQPVMTWKTEITSLRDIQPGTSVGYDETFISERPMRLALVPAGYADGLHRLLSGRGSMLVRGHRVPIVGRVSMDQSVLDVTAVPQAALGDPVVIMGSQSGAHGNAQVPVQEHAALCGTIPYEIFCAVAARVQRIAV